MDIVYSSSDKFSEVFAASLVSLFETNKDHDITVYLIETGISEEHKQWVREIGERYGRVIKMLPMISVEQLASVQLNVPEGCSISTYGRLFLPTMLPSNIDKVLYLDCDTIINGSIEGLWETDISGCMAAMADDGHSMAYRKMLGLKNEGRYFSAGVMLINLKKWRELQIERDFIAYIQSQGGYVPIGDQGVINAVCDGKIHMLPLKYNVYTAVMAFDHQEFLQLRSLSAFYSEEEYRLAKREPVVIHYMTNFYLPVRPWQEGCVHPYADAFLSSKALTEWKDEPLWEDTRSPIKKAYTAFCHAIPRKAAIWISSIIHEHFIAISHKFKRIKHIYNQRRRET